MESEGSERERESEKGEAEIGNGLDFWQMALKAVRKSPEPPNLPNSRAVVKLSDEPLLLFCLIAPSSHLSLSLSALSLFNLFFVLEETLETWPLALG